MYHKNQPVKVGSQKEKPTAENNTSLLIAEKIESEIEEGLETGSLDSTEAAGLNSLANLLRKSATGLLSPTQEFTLMKSLANKKTPSPAQKIEQQTKVDFKITIAEAIEANAPALQASLDKARVYNEELLDRLKGNLMLDGNTNEKIAERLIEEPYELGDLRSGGDGSVKIQSFRNRLNPNSTDRVQNGQITQN